MDKQLQDRVWSILPKEFKEEVKYEYNRVATKATKDQYELGFMHAHEGMYGYHNLTPDAEGEEEMLTVPRKDIVELHQEVEKTIKQCKGTDLAMQAIGIRNILHSFFGSKCLPDVPSSALSTKSDVPSSDFGNEDNFATKDPKQAKPKFKKCDQVLVRADAAVTKDMEIYKEHPSEIKRIDGETALIGMLPEVIICDMEVKLDNLEPYTEPKEDHIAQDHEMVDTILKDGFRNHNRLQIAAMAMQGMLINTTRFSGYEISDLVRISLNCADALLAECEKKGGE